MVKVIHIKTTGEFRTGLRSLERIERRLPEMTREGLRDWGKILERDMKSEAEQAGIQPWLDNPVGSLFDRGIRWEQGKRSDKGYLFMYLYGIYLDSMEPHGVSIHKGRTRLLAWARQTRSVFIRRNAWKVESGDLKNFYVYVKPHPFIANGWNRARPKLIPILAERVRRATHEA